MTLNVTVVTRRRIYQMADFRLTDATTGGLITDESNKLVTIANTRFQGFVTYTGIGRWHRRDTSELLVDRLVGDADLDFDRAAQIIAARGTEWLSDVARQTNRGVARHTFVLAGFEGDRPRLSVISNFENCFRQTSTPATPQLTISDLPGGPGSIAVVTGMKPSVTEIERRTLQRLAAAVPNQPARIRQAMRTLNETASRSPGSRETISEACTIVSLDASGRGAQEVTPEGPITLRGVSLGTAMPDIRQMAESLGLRGARLVQGASASSSASAERRVDCDPAAELVGTADEYELIELAVPGMSNGVAQAVNDGQLVVGTCTSPSDRAASECVLWNVDGTAELFGIAGTCSDINATGAIAATATLRETAPRIRSIRIDDDGPTQLDLFHGQDSTARAINADATVVGWVSLDADHNDQLHQRPAIWPARGGARVLNELPATWGNAIDVNDSGQTLLWMYEGFMTPIPAIYQPTTQEIEVIGGERGTGVVGMAINNAGLVLGFMNDQQGHLALLGTVARGWEPLGTPHTWYSTALADDGIVVGSVREGGFERPWLRHPTGEIVRLPYFRYHHCRPNGLNSRGDIVGAATTDHGSHALLWRCR